MAKKFEIGASMMGYHPITGKPQIEHVVAKFEDGKYREWWGGHKGGIPKYVVKEVMKNPKARKFLGPDYAKTYVKK